MDTGGSIIEFFFFARANRGKSLRVFLARVDWASERELLTELLREPYGVLYLESRVAGEMDPGYIPLADVLYHSVPIPVTDVATVGPLPRLRTLPFID